MIFLKKEPGPIGLCPRLHFRDAESTSEVSIFLWPLATNGESQSLQYLIILMPVHSLILEGGEGGVLPLCSPTFGPRILEVVSFASQTRVTTNKHVVCGN